MNRPAPLSPSPTRDHWAITLSLTIVCAAGALVLGATYLLTQRQQHAAAASAERAALTSLLDLRAGDRMLTIEQSYLPGPRLVVYRAQPAGGDAPARTLVFDLDGRTAAMPPDAGNAATPLGRLFVAYRAGRPCGFVIEGRAQGYKNRIRFLVGLDDSMTVTGVRVVEHEEDPGLGAEIARPWFGGQFIGRAARTPAMFAVAKDPMPEDWRAALEGLERAAPAAWRKEHAARIAAENAKPLYAVTGATISSRAITDGVRATLLHFRHRWELLAPALGNQP